MEIRMNVEKKYAFMILAGILLLAGVVFVIAQSGVPNPGHGWGDIGNAPDTATRWPAWGEVTGKPSVSCSAGQAIRSVNLGNPNSPTCIDVGGGGGGFSSCTVRSSSSGSSAGEGIYRSIASCNSGEVRTGGGGSCYNGGSWSQGSPFIHLGTYPDPDNNRRWITSCYGGGTSGPYAYAICCS